MIVLVTFMIIFRLSLSLEFCGYCLSLRLFGEIVLHSLLICDGVILCLFEF